jgi:hypothetical protein
MASWAPPQTEIIYSPQRRGDAETGAEDDQPTGTAICIGCGFAEIRRLASVALFSALVSASLRLCGKSKLDSFKYSQFIGPIRGWRFLTG